MKRFADKVVIITGAASGRGLVSTQTMKSLTD